ncbi:MAG: metal ABC transporter solute-binding protein, Zn/Mn family [Odoribacter laneus]
MDFENKTKKIERLIYIGGKCIIFTLLNKNIPFNNMISIKLTKILPFLPVLLFFFSCASKPKDERIVSVSILPQQYFVEQIAGDYVKINVMVPPGMNPATSDLNTEQLKKLLDSDICFAVGYLPFETVHLYPVLEGKKKPVLIKHSDTLELIAGDCQHASAHVQHPQASVDPHVWMSPRYALMMSREIYEVLAETYPEKQAVFRANYERLEKRIKQLAQQAEQELAGKTQRTFLIYHPALTYFARDYGLEQISIEEEGKEPDPRHLKKIVDIVREKKIPLIFIQNQFDVNNANSVAAETGAQIIPIDPLSPDWMAEMENLIRILKEKLN